MPPRLSRPGVYPVGASSEWGKWLTDIWCWNPHRHQAIIWTCGGISWALVCWAYCLWRATGEWEIARVPLSFLAAAGAALHLGGCVLTIYVWTKIRLFALLRVLLLNLQHLVLAVLATVWTCSAQRCASAFVLLALVICRGVLLRSYPAGTLALLATGALAALCAPAAAPGLAYHVGVGFVATGYALFLGLAEPVQEKWVGLVSCSAMHLAGLACLGTAIALQVLAHDDAGAMLGAALVGLCPAGIQALGSHCHAAVFLNCAVAAGDLDILEL